jgi:type 1 glutamine amidotransferase
VRVIVDDRECPATRHFGPSIQIHDEIYQLNRYSRDKVRVLMRLDTSTVDMKKKGVERTDGDYAMTWVREFGKGRVFTSVLGHREEVWDRPDIQKMWLEAVLWVLKMTDGTTTTLPLPTD